MEGPEIRNWQIVVMSNVSVGGLGGTSVGGAGSTGDRDMKNVERYDPVRNKWERSENLSTERTSHVVVSI